MGVASLILGIICIIVSVIPSITGIAIILFFIGGILGIIDICAKTKTKNQAIAGLILLIIAFNISILNIGYNSISNDTNKVSTKNVNNIKIYEVGEIVNIGNWQLKVLGSEDKKILKSNYGSKTTENNYVIIKLQIKNLSNEAISLLTTASELTSSSYQVYSRSMLELYDGKSKYIADYNLDNYVENNFNIMFSKINPNTTITYNAVFETDLTTTQKEYKLKLNNNDNILLKIK